MHADWMCRGGAYNTIFLYLLVGLHIFMCMLMGMGMAYLSEKGGELFDRIPPCKKHPVHIDMANLTGRVLCA